MSLQKNVDYIKSINQTLGKEIENANKPDWVNLINSKKKESNFTYKTNNKIKPAYSLENIKKDVKEIIKHIKFEKNGATVFVGAGFGHLLVEALKEKEGNHKIILLEPVKYFLKETFINYDVTEYFQNGTLCLATTPEEAEIILGMVESISVIEDYFMMFSTYAIDRPDEYEKSITAVQEAINQIRCSVGTVIGAGEQIAINDIKNLPYVIKHRGINELKNLYHGKPAVLVSTGPSLAKNIHRLKDVSDKIIIIAVAQALRILLAYDITPDFICTVDYGVVNYDHFKGLMDSKVPLVALNRTYDKILKEYKGPKFICATPIPGFEKTGIGLVTEKGSLEQGGSVAHMCFSLAVHMGCNPITFIGQDLAYEGDLSHNPLADSSGKISRENGILTWKIKDERSSLGKDTVHPMSEIIYVEGYFGEPVQTNTGLASFIKTYKNLIKLHNDKKVYNSTEGGAKIDGAIPISLRRYLDKYANYDINKSKLKKLLSLCKGSSAISKIAVERLNEDIKHLEDVKKYSEDALETCQKIIENKDNKEELKKWLKENEKLSTKAQEAAKKNPLLQVAIFKESRQIESRNLKVNGKIEHVLKDKNDLEVRVNRNEIILKAALSASKKFIDEYKNTIKILEDDIAGKKVLQDDSEYTPSIKDAKDYLKIGNWGLPLLEARKILSRIDNSRAKEVEQVCLQQREKSIEEAEKITDTDKRILYAQLIEGSQAAGKKKKFEEAELMLKEAVELFPEKEFARWGLATIYYLSGQIEKAIKEYEILIDKFPTLKYEFEYGQCLLIDDFQKGMKVIGQVMEKTDEFDNFLARIGDMYKEVEKYHEAIIAYEEYNLKFPGDIIIMKRLKQCYDKTFKIIKSKKLSSQIKKLEI